MRGESWRLFLLATVFTPFEIMLWQSIYSEKSLLDHSIMQGREKLEKSGEEKSK